MFDYFSQVAAAANGSSSVQPRGPDADGIFQTELKNKNLMGPTSISSSQGNLM